MCSIISYHRKTAMNFKYIKSTKVTILIRPLTKIMYSYSKYIFLTIEFNAILPSLSLIKQIKHYINLSRVQFDIYPLYASEMRNWHSF